MRINMKISSDYTSNRAWLRDVVGNQPMILRSVSALEYLQLFVGYFSENKVEVYALEESPEENIRCHIIEDLEAIEYIRFENVLCSSPSQAVNDMLSDFEHSDETALVEALSKYYYSHEESFSGLNIKKENQKRFEELKDWAINYFEVG
ncbi:hypothetical protein HMPREF6123_1233 [Oribacterium sinus F0268]|jgi:hypothetical protein|uniref:Uncharacterized protein n=2 Tax=Oribacterium sinus TaxID=237576 RepID=C2KXL4_9FIRM|nr:hypothetical protein HMPREF6123_1233 [Oribacterium sinus F0268]